MGEALCPQCRRTLLLPPGAPPTCPDCGRPLVMQTQAVTAVACGLPTPSDGPEENLAAEDAALIEELREAFRPQSDEPPRAGSIWQGPQRSSSSGMGLETAADHDLPPGTRFGDFEIIGEIGRGGMGVVYRARQISLGREVALKVLPRFACQSPLAVQRFKAEALAAARLHHTNIVAIYAQGEHEGQFYYAMESIDGVSLDTVIHRQPDLLRPQSGGAPAPIAAPRGTPGLPVRLRWSRNDYRHIARLMSEVADALHFAHQRGVIHRDVKPHNLLVSRIPRLHLTDFGLARLTDQPHLTVSGEVMGTPAYLSPEQVRGDPDAVDHLTDIYSLGATLYELLTGQPPFAGRSRDQIITSICNSDPIPPRRWNRSIPVELETICLRAMEKDPRRRYQTAAAMAEDLRRCAEGRPILARRTSRLTRAVRWVRRRKALTAALAATAAALVLGTSLAWKVHSDRVNQAQHLAQKAYEQLVYYDYRRADLVRPDLEEAQRLGATGPELLLGRALTYLASEEDATAIELLEAAARAYPSDPRVHYLASWARYRSHDRAGSRSSFAQAEQCGPPATADAWFFRGLALHREDPSEAATSYRQAIALRAAQHAFFPQAVLHLARARNQQLYATRSLEYFGEAQESLRQLVAQGQYGAYPHYLLSIAYRLAAEIYAGSAGTRSDAAAEHYRQALEWARRGQALEPNNDRPVTAEAECLESMGLYEEAIAARTRAITLAATERARCEQYHYRWRLYYWTGKLSEAMSDVTAHAACDPQSHCYRHVYPALLLAEMNRMPQALAQARALADEEPAGALATIWASSLLRLFGAAQEAQALLDSRASAADYSATPPQTAEWVHALYDYCRGSGSAQALEELAQNSPTPWKLRAEMHFHGAIMRLAGGARHEALQELVEAYRAFDGEEGYTYLSKLLMVRMQSDPSWPAWISVSW
jgi:serine/threonine protein kinase